LAGGARMAGGAHVWVEFAHKIIVHSDFSFTPILCVLQSFIGMSLNNRFEALLDKVFPVSLEFGSTLDKQSTGSGKKV